MKTLKDFKLYEINCATSEDDFEETPAIDYFELKQAAIEWVKAEDEEIENELVDKNGSYESYSIKRFIKHFFNLTEDDLK